ncbi:MAG: tRNA (adenosine(37)-N6)-threonylcarbamoyltransferase complex ATPase subunit type 1 TsaE [Candidatus Saccharimonadales bacterium]
MEQLTHRQIRRANLKDSAATIDLAAKIGAQLKGGEVIELIGDLGAGKTTFVTGLAKGAKINEVVSSPSFTIRNDYHSPHLSIAHFDFFRLSNPGELKELLSEALGDDPQRVVVIEWGKELSHILPSDRIKLSLKATSLGSREIKLSYPERYTYLFSGVL